MAIITITIDDAHIAQIIDAYAAHFQYKELLPVGPSIVPTVPNPETKIAFAKRMMVAQIRQIVLNHKVQLAEKQASTDAAALIINA